LKKYNGEIPFLAYKAWRCTTKPGKLYFTIFEPERANRVGYFALPDFKNRIVSVRLLGDPTQPPLEVKTTADGRRYFNPRVTGFDSMGETYVVEIEGDSVVR